MTPELGNISLQLIKPDLQQPRTEFDEEKMTELRNSMAEVGQKTPIEVVALEDGLYQIIKGERRWRVATELKWENILALIYRGLDAKERLIRQVLGDLNDPHGPVDRAMSLRRFNREFGMEWSEIDKLTGFTPRRRRQILGILKLPDYILNQMFDLGRRPAAGRITEKHGRALLGLPKGQQVDLFKQIKEKKLTGDEAIKIAQRLKAKNEKPAPPVRVKKQEHVLTLRWRNKRQLIEKLEQKLAELKS